MSDVAMEAARLIDMLPESDKNFAYEFIKKLVIAWDPDFTKTTSEEATAIESAEKSGFIDSTEVDWDNLNKMF